ncbi:MAG: Hemerythrin-like domain-containing protein [Candidatus Methanomarinus sp.]|nr:MAG: Hemerythrin-like domain-containing protein [ANME-2 cluster archaeon]KAF5424449.1 Hemerythrin-like domain-containing protein [ANME-2 cluster archaeon]
MEISNVKKLANEHGIIVRIGDVLDTILIALEDGRDTAPELILADINMLLECSYQHYLYRYDAMILPYLEEIGKSQIQSKLQFFIDQYYPGTKVLINLLDAMESYDDNKSQTIDHVIEYGHQYLDRFQPVFLKEGKEVVDLLNEDLSKEEISTLEDKIDDFEDSWNGPSLMNYRTMVRELELKAVITQW